MGSTLHARLASFGSIALVALAPCAFSVSCGGGQPPPQNVGTTPATESSGTDTEPKVIIEDATEVWYDDTPASPKSKVREYDYDVTWSTTIKGSDAPPEIKKRRVRVVFPVPKVEPKDARDPHVVNRILWDARKQMAACFYKGMKREPTDEMSMVGFLELNKKGELKNAGVEKSDEKMKPGGIDDCIVENVKGLAFPAAGDDTKIRFKLKLQIVDGTALQDFEDTPVTK